jgi:hypothetical protein
MQIIIFGGPVLIGFVLGYFFNTAVLGIISLFIVALIIVLRPKHEQEIGALFGVIAWIVLGISFVTMWGTHLYVSNTSFNIPSISQYIFRQ